jgi:hypothetical protein
MLLSDLSPLMLSVRTEVESLLTEPVVRSCAYAGEPAADDCDCGALMTWLVRQYPSTVFPEDAPARRESCSVPRATQFAVRLYRCIPGLAQDGGPPECSDEETAAALVHSDVHAILAGLCVALRNAIIATTIGDFWIGPVIVDQPSGGCLSVTADVRVR